MNGDDRAQRARRFYDEVSAWTFEHGDLAPTERLTLLACAWHGPEVTAGRRRLSSFTGLATSTVEDALRRLEQRGLMERVGTGPRGVVLRRITVAGLNADVSVGDTSAPRTGPTTGPVSPADHVTATYRRRDGDVTATGPTTGHEQELEQELPLSLNVLAARERGGDQLEQGLRPVGASMLRLVAGGQA